MANLIQITQQDGTVLKTPLAQTRTQVALMPGDTIRVVDAATGKTPAGVKVRKVGNDLLVDGLEDGKQVEVRDFYSTQGSTMKLDGAPGASESTISMTSLADAGDLLYGADLGVATAAGQAGAGAAATAAQTGTAAGTVAATTVPTWAYIAGGALLVGAAAGGGGGGGSSSPAPTPAPAPVAPKTPTVSLADASDTGVKGDKITNLTAPSVSGTADANAKITVSYTDTTGATKTATATADASGAWTATLTGIKEGASTVTVVASDGTTNSTAATYDLTRDSTIAVTAPVLDPLSDTGTKGDNITSALKPTVTGTSEAGATITVSYIDATSAQRSQTTTAGSDGKWSLTLANNLTAGAINTIEATATDVAGNTSAKGSLALTVLTALAVAPTGAVVADASGITPTAGVTTDVTPTLSGTAGGGATSVSITYADALGVSHTDTAAVTGGTWTLAPTFGLALNQATAVSVVSTDGTLSSQPVTVNVTVNSTNTPTAGVDTVVGGTGAKVLAGAAGNDVILGGAGGHVRNGGFEYWKVAGAGDFVDPGSADFVVFGPSANVGWTIAGAPDTIDTGLRTSGALLSLLRADYPLLPAGAPVAAGDHYVFEGAYFPNAGGSGISQAVSTVAGETYSVSIQLSDPVALQTAVTSGLGAPALTRTTGESIVVTWGGTVVAKYDGATEAWTLGAPTGPADANGRVTLNLTGLAGAAGSTTLSIRSYNDADNDIGMRIDSVTVSHASTDGNNVLVGGAGSDVLMGGTGNDTLYGGTLADTSTTAKVGSNDAFVYSLNHANGTDVIKDFHVGVDRLIIADVLDTYRSVGAWDAVTNPDGARLPGATTGATTVTTSDYNLSFRDVLLADSASQHIEVTNNGGFVRLTFTGNGGQALGSVTLEGVAYGTTTDSVAKLMGGTGYNDPTVNAGAATPVLYLTGDGFNAQIAQNVV